MNAPLAMIVLGVYLARTDLKAIFTRPRLYALSAVRLVVIPLLTIVCLMLLPAGWRQIGTVLIIVNAAPSAATSRYMPSVWGWILPTLCRWSA